MRIVNTREHCCVWYQRCSEVLVTVTTKKLCLPFENEIKYRGKIVTPTFKITLYISQTRLNSMKRADLSRKVRNNLETEDGQIMHCKIFFAVALRPNAGHGRLILQVFLDYTQRRTTVGRTLLDE
jgi:hypothetical protein